MSETPPAGAPPPPYGTPVPLQPAPKPGSPGNETEPGLEPTGRRRLPAGWGAWLLVVAAAVAHLAAVLQTVAAGDLVPGVDDLRGQDIFLWIQALVALFVRLDAAWDTSRFMALWMLVLMLTSIYASLRAGMSLPYGVLTFLSYALTSVILVGVATPAVWYALGGWVPAAAHFVPPVAMTAVAALSLRNTQA